MVLTRISTRGSGGGMYLTRSDLSKFLTGLDSEGSCKSCSSSTGGGGGLGSATVKVYSCRKGQVKLSLDVLDG